MKGFGKRALNKAQTRLNILQAMLDLIAHTSFKEMKIKDIAESVQITEMTFFNYFQTKDDLLKYFMAIWSLDQMALQLQEPLAGEAAIRRMFDTTAREIHRHPHVMVTLIGYLPSLYQEPVALEVDPAERYLRYPDLDELYTMPIQSGNDMLLQHLEEMSPGVDHMQTLMHLASCFYGDPLVAYTSGADVQALYKSSLDLVLGNLS